MNCLNLDNADVQQWVVKESLEKAYQVYVDNNYVLPDYSIWKEFNVSVSMSDVQSRLDAILPLSRFSIDKLSKLMNSLPISAQAAYLQQVIYLSENPKLVDVYEEGFHAIFDTLISEEEKKQLLSASQTMLAKKLKAEGKTINQYVKEIATKYPETYATMTQKEKLERVFEEELAKMYVDSLQYKNPYAAEKQLELKLIPVLGATVAKSLAKILTKAFDILKSIYNLFLGNRDTISLFFKQINEGKYRNSIVNVNENSTIPTTRLLELLGEDDFDEEYNEDHTIKTLYSSEETQRIVRNIGSVFFQLQHERIKNSFEDRLNESMFQYFDQGKEANVYNETDRTLINEKNQIAIDALKSDVASYVRDFNSLVDFDTETVESEQGTQNDFAKFESSADESSAYENSYSRQLKLRIAKAGRVKDDSFKVVTIDDRKVNLTFIEAVDVYKTYSAIARALANIDNAQDRWKRLMAFSKLSTNTDTKAFVNQLLYDMFKDNFKNGESYTTIVKEALENVENRVSGYIIFPTQDEVDNLYIPFIGKTLKKVNPKHKQIIGTNNAVIVNGIMKGFDLVKRTNYVMNFDGSSNTSTVYDANLNNVQSVQYNSWLNSITILLGNNDAKLNSEIPSLLASQTKPSAQIAQSIQTAFEDKGILLSIDYISYSIAKYKQSQGKLFPLTDAESSLLANFNVPEDALLDLSDSDNIKTINEAFADIKDISVIKDKKSGIAGRLKSIAEGNSYFDESVPDGTYKTADGKTKYNFQYKTFHLQRINEILKSRGELKNTIPDQDFINPEFIIENYILKRLKPNVAENGTVTESAWQKLINKRAIFSFTADGIRQQDVLKGGKTDESDGVVAGDMSNRDFMLYLLNSAVSISESRDDVKLVPIYFGNYESSKTYEFINLPFIQELIDDEGMLKEEGARLIEDEIKKEFNRIKKEATETREDVYTKYNSGKTVLVNGKKIPYKLNKKTGAKVVDFGDYRALAFSDYVIGLIGDDKLNFSEEFETELTRAIQTGDNVTIEMKGDDSLLYKAIFGEYSDEGVLESIKESINNLNNVTIDKLKDTKAFDLLDARYTKPGQKMGFVSSGNAKGSKINGTEINVKKVATSNLLNTMFINQLMQGDQALLFKSDGVDMFKRFKMRNAAIVSFETDTIAPEYGIDEVWKKMSYLVHDHIIGLSGIDKKEIESADAQNYVTLKYLRYAQYAMGRLNMDLTQLYDMIDQGEDTTLIEGKVFDMELYTPILKTVGFDGSNALKKSDFLLSKRLTSDFIPYEGDLSKHIVFNGRFKALPGATVELVQWSDGTIYEVVPRPEKSTDGADLHVRRKVMEGWRKDGNGWIYNPGNEIMLSMPLSASKLLNKNTLAGHDLGKIEDKNVNFMDLRYYGLQVETAHPHDRIPDPSQYLEIALNELKNALGTKFLIDGIELDTEKLLNIYQEALFQRDDIRFNELFNEIFDTVDDKIVFNKEKFKEMFVRSLEASGNEKQVVELAQQGQFNNPLIRDKYISQIFSYFTKDGLSQKRKGDAAPHFSSYGMKLIKKAVKHTVNKKEHWSWESIPTDSDEYKLAMIEHKKEKLKDLSSFDYYPDVDNKPHTRYTTNRLQEQIKALGEGKYFIDELRHLKPRVENNKITGYFTEAIISKYEKEQKRIYNGQRYMFGVRIPSQDKHSGVNIEWVDMLPAHYGSAVAVAKEIVQLSGSDFDIDKLYLSKQEGYYIGDDFKQYDNGFEDYKKYQFANNQALKATIKKLKTESEIYQKLKSEISAIRENKRVLYNNLKEIEKDFDLQDLKSLKKLYDFKTRLETLDSLIEHDSATKKDLEERIVYVKKLKAFYKSSEFRPFDLSDVVVEYAQTLNAFYDLNTDEAKAGLEAKLVELKDITDIIEQVSLKKSDLPSDSTEFKAKFKGGYSNRGYINNLLLQANQQGLANNQTLNGGSYDNPASMTYMGEGVLKEFILGKSNDEIIIDTKAKEVKVISKDYGVVTAQTNPSKEFDQKLVDAIFEDVRDNAYVENGSNSAQRMWGNGFMWKGNNTKKPKGVPLKVIPAEVDYNANGKLKKVNTPYFYDPLYNDGTSVAPIDDLDFLKRHIEQTLGIDMTGYDVSLNNIYEEGHNLYRHTDIDESNSAKGYPVIVYVLGNDHRVRFDDNGGKRSVGEMVNPKTISLKNGSIYTFGMDGKGRFETVHDVIATPKTNSNFPELTGANGNPTNKYTVTFTFRRAADLEVGMDSAPAKIAINNNSNTKTSNFQGTKGGFDPKGKGTPEGDGKDKAMREVANSAIVELANNKDSSSKTSIGKLGFPKEGDKVIMLARNGELSRKALKQETKEQIREANLDGAEFVVGDMLDVDSQFIDYLKEINAKFTIYHTGSTSRINIDNVQVKKVITGIEIKSDKTKPNSLANRLTNPTWYSDNLFDVETEYKKGQSLKTAPDLNKEDALKYDMELMYNLQLQKFRQNPELIDEINEQGGLEFLQKSNHSVGASTSRWKGNGINSNFIKVLIKTYTQVSKELNKFVDVQAQNSTPKSTSTSTKYLLSDDGGKTFVGSSKERYNVHSFMGHATMHNNVNTGKSNIGIDVNWNLLAIVLHRIQAKINPNNTVTIGDITYDSMELAIKNNKDLRVFDVNSTLTSSATDEAKEQLNARYGFNIDALNAVLPLVNMGGNLSLGIAMVNQPIIKAFLRMKSIKNNAVLSFNEKKDKFKSDNELIKDLTGIEYEDLIKLEGTYTVEDLAKGIRLGGNKEIENLVLRDFIKLSEITEYGANLIAGIKLKKGFGSDIYSYDDLLEKLDNLDVDKKDDVAPQRPIGIREALKRTKNTTSKEIHGKLEIIRKLNVALPEIINLKKKVFVDIKEKLKLETTFISKTARQELNNELESFIYSQLLIKELKKIKGNTADSGILDYLNKELITDAKEINNVEVIFVKFKKAADNLSQFADNPLLKKLQLTKKNGIVSLTLNQLVKLNDTEMTELQDSFTYLTIFDEPLEDSISPLEFTKVLQALFIVKDGMQFRYDGISKIFPTEVFSRFGKVLDDVAANVTLSDEEQQEFVKRYMESVKHKASVFSMSVADMKKDQDWKMEDGEITLYLSNNPSFRKPYNENNRTYNYVYIKVNNDTFLFTLLEKSEGYIKYKKTEITGSTNITTMGIPMGQLVTGQTILESPKPVVINKVDQNQATRSVNLNFHTNYSGAAEGSDKYFEQEFIKQGGRQVNFIVDNLKSLNPVQEKEVEDAYLQAVKDLGRGVLAKNTYAGGLVRRDYLQAKAADSIFAIGVIKNPGENSEKNDKSGKPYKVKSKLQSVDGGTGYAVQMAINLGKPVFVFDQLKNQWFTWNGNSFVETETPILTSKFAGIGTREINENGKKAIRDIINNSIIKPSQNSNLPANTDSIAAVKNANMEEYMKPFKGFKTFMWYYFSEKAKEYAPEKYKNIVNAKDYHTAYLIGGDRSIAFNNGKATTKGIQDPGEKVWRRVNQELQDADVFGYSEIKDIKNPTIIADTIDKTQVNVSEFNDGTVEEDFKVNIDQFKYTYNHGTKIVTRNQKSGDVVEGEETQINKVLVKYALAHDFITKEYNGQNYIKINDKVLNILTSTKVNRPEILKKFDVVSEEIKDITEAKLTEDQQKVSTFITKFLNTPVDNKVDSFSVNNMIMINGAGGTGKTFTITRAIQEYIKDSYTRVAFGAPTHNTKRELQLSLNDIYFDTKAMTAASLFGIEYNPLTKKSDLKKIDDYYKPPVFQYKTLVLDEYSMYGGTLLSLMKQRLEQIKEMYGYNIKIIFSGDYAQIPPVVDNKLSNDYTDGEITNLIYHNNKDKVISLFKNMRTKYEDVANQGRIIRGFIDRVNDIVIYKTSSEKLNDVVKEFNNSFVVTKEISKNVNVYPENNQQQWIDNYLDLFEREINNNLKFGVIVNYNNEDHAYTAQMTDYIRNELFGTTERFVVGDLLMMQSTDYSVKAKDGEHINVGKEDRLLIKDLKKETKKITIDYKNKGTRSFSITVDVYQLTVTNDEKKEFDMLVLDNNNTISDYFSAYSNLNMGDLRLEGEVPHTKQAYTLISQLLPQVSYGYVVNSHKVQGSSYGETFVDEDNILTAKNFKEKLQLLYTAYTRTKFKTHVKTSQVREINKVEEFVDSIQEQVATQQESSPVVPIKNTNTNSIVKDKGEKEFIESLKIKKFVTTHGNFLNGIDSKSASTSKSLLDKYNALTNTSLNVDNIFNQSEEYYILDRITMTNESTYRDFEKSGEYRQYLIDTKNKQIIYLNSNYSYLPSIYISNDQVGIVTIKALTAYKKSDDNLSFRNNAELLKIINAKEQQSGTTDLKVCNEL